MFGLGISEEEGQIKAWPETWMEGPGNRRSEGLRALGRQRDKQRMTKEGEES